MTSADWWSVTGVGVLLVVAALLGASETSLARMTRVRALHLEEQGKRWARLLVKITEDPARYLNPVLVTTLGAHLGGTVLATSLAVRRLGGAGEWIATAVMTAVIFVLAESAPKTYTVLHTDRVAVVLAPLIYALGRVLYPLARVLVGVSNILLPGKGLPKGPFMSEEEIRHVVDVAEEEEVIEEQEREMIHSIFELGDTIVREVMVPRPDMIVVETNYTIQAAMDLAIREGYSRIPVYENDPDNIVGVVYAKDLFRALRGVGQQNPSLKDIVREAYFVPETMRSSELLREMQKRRVHMAIVADEYGDVAGLVTLEDILEEIVGEITDEYDVEESRILPVGDNGWRVQAKMPIWEFNELIEAKLPEDKDFQTIGGLVASTLAKIPEAGDEVTYDGFSFRVERVQRRRIGTVLVRRLPESHGVA